METTIVSSVSERRRAEVILDAAGRLFLAPGPGRVGMDDLARDLGMSKKTIYRYFPDKHSLLIAVLDRQFEAVEHTLAAAAEATRDRPFGEQMRRFLLAAAGELGRIGAAQLATGRGDAVLRRHVEQRIEAVVYRRLEELFREGYRRGQLSAPPELLAEITRGAVERLLNSRLPHELDCTAADLLRSTVDILLHGAIRPGRDDEQEAAS
ncbi:TetR/AcrR family transcriptional regulator [Nocardia sp. alder85J]|uniref:TetR/AcrR family transcriptional regulator n=1 Tax=Nocardia sp. alder85J TaxID=2862949 RepID=UPI001CD76A7D|nr:TetR/AcrR family transcriptional regulator [Nocardia sp. alder85J]MCX4092378.1 TetR/AcrR family transcriptional regulator [Nocardia sp. alder85J]